MAIPVLLTDGPGRECDRIARVVICLIGVGPPYYGVRMSWQRLSQRTAGMEPDGPYEGVPEHLKYPVIRWLRQNLELDRYTNGNEYVLRELAIRLRIPLPLNTELGEFGDSLLAAGGKDEGLLLDLVDAVLEIQGPGGNRYESLERILISGASTWRVGNDFRSLARLVTEETQATYEAATSVVDEATKELKEAWANAFGRNGDPSDAWDHAIKAVEDVLIPAMMPNNGNATLGSVIGELNGQNGQHWKLVLPGNNQDHDVAHLVSMLRLMWPNHDRHGGASPKRTPSEQEARAVVTLAATIVQWHREGWVVQRR
ncbi:hypothetical protein [Mycolicibacterium fortuitum]|uniref:Uncharacterized protein n=2 Tax=Mycolicibacterium fortuitum TaxID=1766 RepID=A0AAE4VEH9_MYCFO|nr:hypothetical protein [Mycolicibacterium fortuitum]MCV7142028.1 hypothetical protein [Mycolicibacterium fortuitum]MDV7192286.1 hypothetical protein [Mycolicibacterium fortuitum]MDV7205017.1 hypothetical protein [Mycolicibacterium fortuitum]MDV7226690.1 hypothetical protein [Mycolicibacterium fortuitum]MDV7259274.1 hypothetical protein [Mycolicibacterium fortuitum]